MKKIYTIGHSNVGVEDLLRSIQLHRINCIIDVRSVPASSYSPQFNKEPLKNYLKNHNITYAHFGEEFGARRTDCIVNGQVNFEQAIKTNLFRMGYSRVNDAIDLNFNVALMCSEANPLECHRFAFISRYFYDNGFEVLHILKDGNVKTHKELESEMIKGYLKSRNNKLKEVDISLFGDTYTAEEQRIDAYRIKNEEIGYRVNDSEYDNKL
ncbi:MAG: DUF488 domain-containing protein [Alistipes sp.]|nr:DUF488 domain-containing protein [Alistipes sp.]